MVLVEGPKAGDVTGACNGIQEWGRYLFEVRDGAK